MPVFFFIWLDCYTLFQVSSDSLYDFNIFGKYWLDSWYAVLKLRSRTFRLFERHDIIWVILKFYVYEFLCLSWTNIRKKESSLNITFDITSSWLFHKLCSYIFYEIEEMIVSSSLIRRIKLTLCGYTIINFTFIDTEKISMIWF